MEQTKNLIKTVVFGCIVPGFVFVYVPWRIAAATNPNTLLPFGPIHGAAYLFWAVGGLIMAWAAGLFAILGRGTPAPIDPPKDLVIRGLYRYTRNPMYVGAMIVLIGQTLWFQSPGVFLYTVIVGLSFHLYIRFYEEPVLTERFGDAYRRYCKETPRWGGWL
jgi:protein-S-isoprenylcysteine O-methyltransferase Ste14